KAGAKRRRSLLLLFVALAVVVVVLAVAVPVGVVMSNRKTASSSAADSSSGGGGGGSGTSASGSAGVSTSNGATSGDGTTTSTTTDSAASGSSTVSSDALVASGATASSTTSGQTASSTTASSLTCSQTQVDAFTSSTNLLGFATGDDGTMKSLSRSSGQVVFVPKSGSYFYESLRNDDGGSSSSSSCGAAVAAFNYIIFTITGSGSAEVDIKTGCSEVDHYTASFAAGSSAVTYAVDVEATVGSSALAADVSAFTWEAFKLSSSSAQWTVTGVYFVNDLSACGISATVIS
ncbi:hypothetical protein HK405_008957, partial [Cladochytrium tenue]